MAGNTTKTPEQAAVLVHILRTPEDLHNAIAAALGHPDRHLWCIYGKGKVDVGATLVRATARAAGLIDSKSCGVSETLTATRYRMRTG